MQHLLTSWKACVHLLEYVAPQPITALSRLVTGNVSWMDWMYPSQVQYVLMMHGQMHSIPRGEVWQEGI